MLDNQTTTEAARLGLTLLDGGGVFSVWSGSAEEISLHILNPGNTQE